MENLETENDPDFDDDEEYTDIQGTDSFEEAIENSRP
jgi:hypothetical protein